MVFTNGGIQYQPAGLGHAVEMSAISGSDAVLAYAICGQAVRVWPDEPFKAAARDLHEACAVAAHTV